jgi:hypothetical protein
VRPAEEGGWPRPDSKKHRRRSKRTEYLYRLHLHVQQYRVDVKRSQRIGPHEPDLEQCEEPGAVRFDGCRQPRRRIRGQESAVFLQHRNNLNVNWNPRQGLYVGVGISKESSWALSVIPEAEITFRAVRFRRAETLVVPLVLETWNTLMPYLAHLAEVYDLIGA